MPITRHPIAKARQGRGLDREILACRCGTTAVEIESWEEGLYWPQPEVAVRLARALGLSLEEIYVSLIEREYRLHHDSLAAPDAANDASLGDGR